MSLSDKQDKCLGNPTRLDEETERLITDMVVAAVRQFRDETSRTETKAKTDALRQRIRKLVREAHDRGMSHVG